ncbi:MAG: hypothetical protein IPG50_16790 [Myxococcales bacterium]|nr:hypothetical protein [Myxococcales bacterium]
MRPVQLGSTLSLLALFVVGCSDHVERLDDARQAKSGSAAVAGGTGLPTTPNSGVVPPLPGSGTGNPGVPGLPGTGGTSAVACQPKAPQAAPLWRPPSPPRKACTQQEGAAVVSCMLQKQGCQTPVSAACQSCAITVKGQGSYYGPIIVDPQTGNVEINVEGCAALASGDLTQAGCGGRLQARFACEDQACAHCGAADRQSCMAAAAAGPCSGPVNAAKGCESFAQQCMGQDEMSTAFNLVGTFCG